MTAALCDDPIDDTAWASVCAVKDDLRAGLFAVYRSFEEPSVVTHRGDGKDDDRTLSLDIIRSNLHQGSIVASTCIAM